jgi:hypothetical protein
VLLYGTSWVSKHTSGQIHSYGTAKVRDLSQISPREFRGGKCDTGTGFLLVLSFSFLYIIPPILHAHLHLHGSLTIRTNRLGIATLQKAMRFRK